MPHLKLEKLHFTPLKFGTVFNLTFNVSIFAMHPRTSKFLQFDQFYPKIPILLLIFCFFFFFYIKKIGVQKWLAKGVVVFFFLILYKNKNKKLRAIWEV